MSASLIWVGILQAVVYLLFVRAIDLYEREELKYVIPVFVWGFTVAVVLSFIFEGVFSYATSAVTNMRVANFLTAVVGAPVIEECAKGLALLVAFAVASMLSLWRGELEFSGVMDGIVYGSAVAFGFSIAEDIVYYAQFGQEVFLVRRIFGGFDHAAFTSLTGIGIGLIPWVRWRILKVLVPIIGLLAAITLHATFNFTATFFGPLVFVLEFFMLLGYILLIMIWLAIERRIIRAELRGEVEAGTISAGEYAILPTYFARRSYYLGLILGGHLLTWRRARKLHETAVNLAFTKRLSHHPHAAPQQHKIQLLRRRIASLRGGQTLQYNS